MKSKNFLLGFMLLSAVAFGLMVETRGVTYYNKVTDGTVVTLTGTYNTVSYSIKYTASGVTSNSITWGISITAAGVEAPSGSVTQTLLADPSTETSWDVLTGDVSCPSDVADYLSKVATAIGATASGTTITIGDSTNGEVATYDANTCLCTSLKYYVSGVLVYELSAPGIPGYELPVLLGIMAISTIGLIFIIRRKK